MLSRTAYSGSHWRRKDVGDKCVRTLHRDASRHCSSYAGLIAFTLHERTGESQMKGVVTSVSAGAEGQRCSMGTVPLVSTPEARLQDVVQLRARMPTLDDSFGKLLAPLSSVSL